jgi:hypothetical protein
MSGTLKKELILAAALIAFGLLVLPYAIYLVGTLVIGPYDGEAGAVGLGLAIWGGLVRFEWPPWVLVSSPYLVVQLLRLALRAARSGPRVKAVTD